MKTTKLIWWRSLHYKLFLGNYEINPWKEQLYYFNVTFNEEVKQLKEYKQAVKAKKEEEYDN